METKKIQKRKWKLKTNGNLFTIQVLLRMLMYWMFMAIEMHNKTLNIGMGTWTISSNTFSKMSMYRSKINIWQRKIWEVLMLLHAWEMSFRILEARRIPFLRIDFKCYNVFLGVVKGTNRSPLGVRISSP